jgi:hypothetical protein
MALTKLYCICITEQTMETLRTLKSYESSYCRKSIWMLLKLSFGNLHQLPRLKSLTVYFDVRYHPVVPYDSCGYPPYKVVREIGNSHQWDILYAIGNNKNPLTRVQLALRRNTPCTAHRVVTPPPFLPSPRAAGALCVARTALEASCDAALTATRCKSRVT